MAAYGLATVCCFQRGSAESKDPESRDEVDEDPGALLALAARAEFDGRPPEVVREWLDDVGIEV